MTYFINTLFYKTVGHVGPVFCAKVDLVIIVESIPWQFNGVIDMFLTCKVINEFALKVHELVLAHVS